MTVARTALVKPICEFAATLWRNRALMVELVLRDIRGSHAGHGLGSTWVYVQPIVVVTTFMLIFGIVIGAKLAISDSFPGDYTSYILIGLVPWMLMQNALSRGPTIFLSNANLVKQVVFPVEVLPIASLIASFLTMTPAFVVMIAYKLLWGGGLQLFAFWIAVAVLLHAIMALGIMMILSVITPFLRDVREFVTIYLTVSMYFTPAIYLPEWVPVLVRPIIYFNPFSYVVWVYQDVLFYGEMRHGFAWITVAFMALAAGLGGIVIFRKIRPYLGNVL